VTGISIVEVTHYSLLRSREAAFGVPCLAHACDAVVPLMTSLFHHN
jgi:hypothetical protein